MKQLLPIIIIVAFINKTNAQGELHLTSQLQCSDYSYCIDIELNATTGNTFDLGTSSILLDYNTESIVFKNYTPQAFDSLSTCVGTWSPQQYDLDEARGEFSLTLKLKNPSSTCLTVNDATPNIIGTLCFDILQQGASPDIKFDNTNTLLNRNIPDNGTNAITIALLDSIDTIGELACDCIGAGTPCDDQNVFTTNDQFDINCNCSGETLDSDGDGLADGVDACKDVFYEAEDAYIAGPNIKTSHPQYFGNGYVDWAGWNNDSLRFTFQITDTGSHDLAFRFANGGNSPRYLELSIDGVVVNSSLAFPNDTSWAIWDTVFLTQNFTIGTHTLLLRNQNGHGPNIDRMTISYCNGCTLAGTPCDDGDPCTMLDTYDANCNCKGVFMDADDDGVCDINDVCADGDDTVDTDGDGTPDDCDNCDNSLIGTACNDNNPCTFNDTYDANCNCIGIFTGIDADSDGVCDAYDICPGGDDNADLDGDGIPDFCDTCNDLTIGLPCDDGDPCTILDVVTAGCGCAGNPIPINIAAAIDSVTCNGFDDGIIDLNISGSFGDLLYDWSHGDTLNKVENLAPGFYTVRVQDFRGCKDSATYLIEEPAPLIVTPTTVAASDTNGSIVLSASGGTAPYLYLWDDGDTINGIFNLIPGTYEATVTDYNGCADTSFTDVYPADMCVDTVIQAEAGLIQNMGTNLWHPTATLGSGYIYFSNDSLGRVDYTLDIPSSGFYTIGIRSANKWSSRNITIEVDGQVEFLDFLLPRTYDWLTYEKAEFVQYFTDGQHTLTLKHRQDWSARIDFISICNQVVVPITSDAIVTDNTCYGDSVGQIIMTPTGGTRNYAYKWSTGDTSYIQSNLLAGDYYVTITDEVGQTAIDTFTIAQPTQITPIFTLTEPKCNGYSNGKIKVDVSGGTPNYSYNWSSGQTWTTAWSLTTGTYTLTITDYANCVVTHDIFLPEPDTLEATFVNTPTFDSTGTIDMTVLGGTLPYSYKWNGGDSLEDRTDLKVGHYRVTITDDNNCKLYTGTDVLPAGVCMDTLIQAEDGLLTNVGYHIWYPNHTTGRGYMYISNDSTGRADYTLNILHDGYYTVGFRYAHSWDDREITIDIDGTTEYLDFTFPKTNQWSNYQYIEFIKYFTAGSHILTLKYRQDWGPRIDFINICDKRLRSTIVKTDNTCYGDSTGSATVIIEGGFKPISHLWSTGDTTTTIANLPPGSYTVTITDSIGQMITDTVDILQPQDIVPTFVKTEVDCNGNATGSATALFNGSTNFIYNWNTLDTSNTISNLVAGTYTVTLTDANGCFGSASVTITEPTVLQSSITNTTDVACFGDNSGTATALATGGTAPYNYNWNNGDNVAIADSLLAGTYTVTITDANGCITNDAATINQPQLPLTVVPNMVTDVACNGTATGSASILPSGGTSGYSYLWSNGDTTILSSNLLAGNYDVTVTDAHGCMATTAINITQPSILAATTSTTAVSCNGGNDGTATALPTGGVSGYTYLWNFNDTAATVTNLAAGSYTVTITDVMGCTTTATALITEPTVLQFSHTITTSSGNDGSIDITTTGGTSPYTYLWNDNVTTEDRNNLVVGNYTLTITDANGCTISKIFTIYPDGTCTDYLYEAENAAVNGATASLTTTNGALGQGYVDFGSNTNESLTFTVQPSVDSFYEITIRYAQGTADKAMEISIDGNITYSSFIFPKTTTWNTWGYMTFKEYLTAGTHTITLKNIAGDGPDIDYLNICATTSVSTRPISPLNPTLQTYPNPASHLLTIDIELAAINKGTLHLIDESGRVLVAKTIASTGGLVREQIDVSRLAAGIYIVLLKTERGNVVKRVLVVD